MRKVLLILWIHFLLRGNAICAFVLLNSNPSNLLKKSCRFSRSCIHTRHKVTISHVITSHPRTVRNTWLNALSSSSTSSSNNTTTQEDEFEMIKASVVVGAVTALMGFIYGKVLAKTVKSLWQTLPIWLSSKDCCTFLTPKNPGWYIPSICTLGGLSVGLLSAKFSKAFTVADFVGKFAEGPAEIGKIPQSRTSLLPLLLLSLATSTFGFSVGPEAPMVCAGGLVGVSIAKRWFANENDKEQKAQVLAYAGAAGALTAFMGIPLAGSIFALELTRSSAGMSRGAKTALSPAVASSVAAIFLIRFILLPSSLVGGHFSYGTVGPLTGRAMILVALASGMGGGVIGTSFHKLVSLLKGILWPPAPPSGDNNAVRRQVLVKTIVGLLVGLLSSRYPQTLFWGEGSLGCVIDGQKTAFGATKHGLPSMLLTSAIVNPSLPFSSASAAAQVGIAKLISIALACAGKFPGGIIFPLFFAAAPLAHAFTSLVPSSALPVVVMSLMASTQASVTRTPLATALILSLTASASTPLSVMLPAVLVASYCGVWTAQFLSSKSYFKYSAK